MNSDSHIGGYVGTAIIKIDFVKVGQKHGMRLDWELPLGHGNTDNIESGLLRPFRSILEDGKPIGQIVYFFYEEEGKQYVLGTFCKSQKKILFFPGGYNFQLIGSSNSLSKLKSKEIDHFTLDEKFETWHITFKKKKATKSQLPRKKTWKMQDGRILWFVMQANSVKDFEKAPHKIKTILFHKESELERRAEEIMKSREGSEFKICTPRNGLGRPNVINFEFYLSEKGKMNFSGFLVHHAKLDSPLQDMRGVIPNMIYQVKIPKSNITCGVRVSQFPGSNKSPWNLIPGAYFKKLHKVRK